MTTGLTQDNGDQAYQEREAVAVFDDEASLRAAADALMQIGFRQDDMSLLADAARLSGDIGVKKLADADNVPHAAYVSVDSRTEGMASLVGAPAYVLGAGAAAIVATGGAALIPTIAVAVGGGAVGGALGLLLARAFGQRHAGNVERQIASGGLLLWVRAPDTARDVQVIDILKRNGGRDVHVHVVNRTWGPADVPLHDLNPDPLLEKS